MEVIEIVGFPEPRRDKPAGQFDLVDRLLRVKRVEIERIIEIADRLSQRYGPAIVVGFLYYEILGRPPDAADCARLVRRLSRAPAAVPVIVEELLARADVSEPGRASHNSTGCLHPSDRSEALPRPQ